MRMKIAAAAILIGLALPAISQAHKAWLLPSQTVIAGENPWITVDAAISNDLFYFNHVPMPLERIAVTAPDGTSVEKQNGATGKFRSVFDVNLTQQGTYRIASVNSGLMATWDDNGSKRWRGTPERFAAEVPQNARNLKVSQTMGRVETFVTNGAPNDVALKPVNQGLELTFATHPTDLVSGEPVRMTLLLDGKPAPGVSVEIVRGSTRYRNSQDEVTVKTDANGEFVLDAKVPGMYWLEIATTDNRTAVAQAKERRLTYVATLEVLPE